VCVCLPFKSLLGAFMTLTLPVNIPQYKYDRCYALARKRPGHPSAGAPAPSAGRKISTGFQPLLRHSLSRWFKLSIYPACKVLRAIR
jgi:hypothetical protein